jgi:hypothetical protein
MHLMFLIFLPIEPAPGTREEALAAESQAIGRAHRQGQSGRVTVVRYYLVVLNKKRKE